MEKVPFIPIFVCLFVLFCLARRVCEIKSAEQENQGCVGYHISQASGRPTHAARAYAIAFTGKAGRLPHSSATPAMSHPVLISQPSAADRPCLISDPQSLQICLDTAFTAAALVTVGFSWLYLLIPTMSMCTVIDA